MANYFNLTLDTIGPATPGISIDAGAAYAATQTVSAGITTGDGVTTGYTMKIWGSVDPANDANVQATEGASAWVAFAATKAIKLSTGDGLKTLNLKIRDDVLNESSATSDTITLDTAVPVVTITSGPDVTKIPKNATKNTCAFAFSSDSIFEQYEVRVVPATNSLHTAGTAVLTANGSTNMAGSAGGYPASTPISCTINGTDLETASAGDGAKIVKVFMREASGGWSV